jgi:hypothetical protein
VGAIEGVRIGVHPEAYELLEVLPPLPLLIVLVRL